MQKQSSCLWLLCSLQFPTSAHLSGAGNRDLFQILAGLADKCWKHLLLISSAGCWEFYSFIVCFILHSSIHSGCFHWGCLGSRQSHRPEDKILNDIEFLFPSAYGFVLRTSFGQFQRCANRGCLFAKRVRLCFACQGLSLQMLCSFCYYSFIR